MLSIFSCACWPSVCLLWRNVHVGLLPIFDWLFVAQLHAYQEASILEKALSNQADKMTQPINIRQSSPLTTTELAQWAHEQSGYGGRGSGYSELNSMNSHLPRKSVQVLPSLNVQLANNKDHC